MQALSSILELARTRLAGLPPSAKLLAGSLTVIVALALFLVAQWSARTDTIPFAVMPTAYDEARQFLATRGVEYEEKNGKLMVPVNAHPDLVAGFMQQGGGGEIDWDKLVPSDPFAPESERRQRYMLAVQTVLSKAIASFANVKSATVIIAPRSTTPLGNARSTRNASVTVSMRTGALTQDQVDSIASMVAGTQEGMKPEFVAVTDGAQAYRTSFGRGVSSGENLEQSQKHAEKVRSDIATVLASIPGVRIAVNAQVVTTDRTKQTIDYKEPVSAPLSETSSSSESKGASAQREPGVVPNTGLAIGPPASSGSQSTIERSDNKYQPQWPGTQITEKDKTGYAVKIDASIAVPLRHFEQIWLRSNPPAAGAEAKLPDEAAISPIRDAEIARIKKLIEPLIATDVAEGAKKGSVEVTWDYDFAEQPVERPFSDELVRYASTDGNGLIKPIGLGILAIVSLFFMFNIAKKASAREDLPTAEELAGVPPKLESDDAEIVGEADEASPALEGMELDDESLRRAQMLKQLNGLADRDPAEIAGILRRWMRTPA